MLPAEAIRDRVTAWAKSDDRVRAAYIFGSVANGTATEHSDLDVVVVSQPGQLDALWSEAVTLAARWLGGPVVFSKELPWQGPCRLQAHRADLAEIDVGFVDAEPKVWGGIARGYAVLVDKDGEVTAQLEKQVAEWSPPAYDAAEQDNDNWLLLHWTAGKVRHGRGWFARVCVNDFITRRLLPVLDVELDAVEEQDPELVRRLEAAQPGSTDRAELTRALLATAGLYDAAYRDWCERHGAEYVRSQLADPVLHRLHELEEEHAARTDA